jgi:GTPase SAR1 family protein
MATQAPVQTGGGGTKAIGPGAFQVRSMRNTAHQKWFNGLFYGKHGAGKTTLLASAVDVPQMNDVLVVTAEGGTVVFEDNDRITAYEDLDVIKIDRIEQFNKVYEFVKAHVSMRDDPSKEAALRNLQKMVIDDEDDRLRRYRTVIIDSLSEIEALNLSKILNLDALGLDAGDDMEVAGFPQFRKNMHLMQRIIRQFRDLNIHVLVTCAESFTQDERKAYHYGPKLTGQLSGIVQGFFDVVGWLVVGQKASEDASGPRRLFVQPQSNPKADAKCRLAAYKSDYFDNPTMHDIMVKTGFIKE